MKESWLLLVITNPISFLFLLVIRKAQRVFRSLLLPAKVPSAVPDSISGAFGHVADAFGCSADSLRQYQ